MRTVILGSTAVTAAAGVLVWLVVSDGRGAERDLQTVWRPGVESVSV